MLEKMIPFFLLLVNKVHRTASNLALCNIIALHCIPLICENQHQLLESGGLNSFYV